MSKTIEQKITQQFQKYGYEKDSLLSEQQLYKVFDILAFQNASLSQFDKSIAQQIWQRTQKTIANCVKVETLISTIVQGQKLIRFHIANKQEEHKYQKNEKVKEELRAQIFSFVKDYDLLSHTFKIASINRNSLIQASEKDYQAILQKRSGVFQFKPSPGPHSFTLKVVFLGTIFLLMTQLCLLFEKRSFIHLLALLAVLVIFLMNYFDKNYVKFCLIIVAISNILDSINLSAFIKLQIREGIQSFSFQQKSIFSFQLKIILITASILVKSIIFILIFRYQNNERNVRKTVQCFGMKFFLDAKQHPFKKNPISSIYDNQENQGAPDVPDIPTQY